MAKTTILASPQIVKGETSITQDVFNAHGSEALVRGELCFLEDGVLRPARTDAGNLDTGAPDNPSRLFISLEDVEANSGKVKATEIKEDTILEGFVVDQGGDDINLSQSDIGKVKRGYRDADGKWAIDNDDTNGIFEIVDVQDNYMPYKHPDSFGWDMDGDDRYGRVQFKVSKSRLL